MERQRELTSLRLKKVFGISVDDENRKPGMLLINNNNKKTINVLTKAPPALDVQTILNCELPSVVKTIPPSPNFPIPGSCDLNAATAAARSSPNVESTLPPSSMSPSPVNPPVVGSSVTFTPTPQNFAEKKTESPAACQKSVDNGPNDVETSPKKSILFYTPDEEEKRAGENIQEGYQEVEPVEYVPPFNNPIYPNDNDNFPSYASGLGKFYSIFKNALPKSQKHVHTLRRFSLD